MSLTLCLHLFWCADLQVRPNTLPMIKANVTTVHFLKMMVACLCFACMVFCHFLTFPQDVLRFLRSVLSQGIAPGGKEIPGCSSDGYSPDVGADSDVEVEVEPVETDGASAKSFRMFTVGIQLVKPAVRYVACLRSCKGMHRT